MTAESKLNRLGRARPVGGLAEILKTYQAPDEAVEAITSRIGGITGIPRGIRHQDIETVITNTMIQTGGTPNWEVIAEKLREAAKKIYDGKRPRYS